MTDVNTLYEEDFLAWSKQQASALRAVARAGSNHPLDWHNLAEEIEGLGISQRSALRSQIRRIIRHLLKLEFSRAIDPRRGWVESIGEARAEVEDLLETSPSLRSDLQGDIAAQTKRAIELAIRDLRGYDEIDDACLSRLRVATFTEEQVLGDWFPEQPPR
jgi:hypothetical protein